MEAVKYVDTIIGTIGDLTTTSAHGGGKTHPGVVRPSGMVQLSPDTITGGDNGSGYSYHHDTIEGFSFNHMSGVGWYGDLGNLQVMPTTGEMKFHSGSNEFDLYKGEGEGWRSKFRHETEVAQAGYYAVTLDTYNIRTELTATDRTGILRFTFPASDTARIQIDLARRIAGRSVKQYIKVVNGNTIEGYIHCPPEGGGFGHGGGHVYYTLHFYARFSRDFGSFGIWSFGEDLGAQKIYEGEDLGFYANFKTAKNETILFKAGISYVDIAGAKNNLETELNHWDFDRVVTETNQAWEKALGIIKVDGGTEEQKTVFYTNLYHTLLDPRIHSDCDGRYFGADRQIHRTGSFNFRTVFSGWDVFRSEFPLLTIIAPDVVNDEINSLIEIAEATGSTFPRWELMAVETGGMIGDPGVVVTADAYVKGIRNYDIEKAYKISRAAALEPYSTRNAWDHMIRLGYAPKEISVTLENAFSGWCIFVLADTLGKTEDRSFFKKQAMNYKNTFDTSVGWMRQRDRDGGWVEWNGKYNHDGCVESNVFQQNWFVPHDVQGLINLMGRGRFLKELENLFEGADLSSLWNEDYNHSNEPCHHVPHLFNFAGQPWRTQYWVRRIQNEAYRTGPYGYCGNEDVGQMSAWLVLTAMGIHSTTPGSGIYNINTPMFQRMELILNKEYHNRAVSDKLIIETDKDPNENRYIHALTLNGKPLDRCWITHDELTAGGTILFTVGAEPNYQWGIKNPPASMSKSND